MWLPFFTYVPHYGNVRSRVGSVILVDHKRGRNRLHEPVAVMTAFKVGTARVQGRFERPSDGFVLHSDLEQRGAVALDVALAQVGVDWERQVAQGTVLPQTVKSHQHVLKTFANFLKGRSIQQVTDVDGDLLLEWMYAVSARSGEPPTTNMVVQRRAVARTIYGTFALLGITDLDITSTLGRIRRPNRAVDALSGSDIERLKEFADSGRHVGQSPSGSGKAPSAVALALIGVQTPEIPEICVKDIHLLDQRVWVHGGSDRYQERWIPIDDSWAFESLAARVSFLVNKHGVGASDMKVAYESGTKRGGTGERNASASVCNTIDKVMRTAGLKKNKKVRVASITEHVAMRVWGATGRVEAVAARLGMSSLDRAAHLVGYDWRPLFDENEEV